jgi:hypothetical protein
VRTPNPTSVVRSAINRGELVDLKKENVTCVECRKKRATVYDHRDYKKLLEVDPVCQGCNAKRGPAKNRFHGGSLLLRPKYWLWRGLSKQAQIERRSIPNMAIKILEQFFEMEKPNGR